VGKIKGWQSGMLVLMRNLYGNDAGALDEHHLYQIQQIGPKQATIKSVNMETGQVDSWRGRKIRIFTKEEADEYNARNDGRSWRQLYPYDWGQVFVPQGEAGWDPERNF